jgi:hypothetical protein
VSEHAPKFFSRVLTVPSFTIANRAVAGAENTNGCIYALSGNVASTAKAISIASGADLEASSCSIVDNSTANGVTSSTAAFSAPGATVNVSPNGSIAVVGSAYTTGSTILPSGAVQTGVPVSPDPFGPGSFDQSAAFGTSASWSCGGFVDGVAVTRVSISDNNAHTISPGVYCGNGGTAAIDIGGDKSTEVTFQPGLYIINGGGMKILHTLVCTQVPSGPHCVTPSDKTGLTFYFTSSSGHAYPTNQVVQTDGPDGFHLYAPKNATSNYPANKTTGVSGFLMVQDRSVCYYGVGSSCSVKVTLQPNQLNVNGGLDISGVVYFPGHEIDYGAITPGGGDYLVLIGNTLVFSNSATLNTNYTGLAGGSPVKRTATAE